MQKLCGGGGNCVIVKNLVESQSWKKETTLYEKKNEKETDGN